MAKFEVLKTFRGIEERKTFKTGEIAEFDTRRATAINKAVKGALKAVKPENEKETAAKAAEEEAARIAAEEEKAAAKAAEEVKGKEGK